jgi:hypothetical protein
VTKKNQRCDETFLIGAKPLTSGSTILPLSPFLSISPRTSPVTTSGGGFARRGLPHNVDEAFVVMSLSHKEMG